MISLHNVNKYTADVCNYVINYDTGSTILVNKEPEKRFFVHPRGIAYLYNSRLDILPEHFASRTASSYLTAMKLLADYPRTSDYTRNGQVYRCICIAGYEGYAEISGTVFDPHHTDAFLALSVLLFITSQHERFYRDEWLLRQWIDGAILALLR